MTKNKNKKKGVPYAYRYKGKGKHKCRICGTTKSVITSYGLQICRKCFREVSNEIGFRKY